MVSLAEMRGFCFVIVLLLRAVEHVVTGAFFGNAGGHPLVRRLSPLNLVPYRKRKIMWARKYNAPPMEHQIKIRLNNLSGDKLDDLI
jgi:hypothetical protein